MEEDDWELMISDSELKQKGSLVIGLAMILSALTMYAIVMPVLLKWVEESIIAVPVLFICALFGCAVLTAVFYFAMTSVIGLLTKLIGLLKKYS
ncbi:MAG: hypothetical protein DSO01_07160 [Archaeoglobi archaeon]|nr:MAG: hypothetical protein DSO01_07160 [Archaeoglobi archaeon]TDA26908.1 MAG: hypothetical protein DSO00_07035 [Archaeoglobi archaeon]